MIIRSVATLLGAFFLGVSVPWVAMRMLAPSLEASPAARATNFRGRTVHYGLGVVWLIWAGSALIGSVVGSASSVLAARMLTLVGPLALVAFALGVVDDAYGSSDSRGFRGHLLAMLKGRLTTGGLKLIGIGAASLAVAFVLSSVCDWGRVTVGSGGLWGSVGRATATLIAGAAIALTSNLVNLADLRPGRALKLYCVLAVAAVASFAVFATSVDSPVGVLSAGGLAREAGVLALFLVGPVIAVWRDDLGERGMLGDAGANPMGAVTGMLIVTGLSLVGLVTYFLAVLALNLASERVSFSAVIDANPVLARIDGFGRLQDVSSGAGEMVETVAHDEASHV